MNTKRRSIVVFTTTLAALAVPVVGEVLNQSGKIDYDTLKILRVGGVLAAIPIAWLLVLVQQERVPKLSTVERVFVVIQSVCFVASPVMIYVRSLGHLTIEEFTTSLTALNVVWFGSYVARWLVRRDASTQT